MGDSDNYILFSEIVIIKKRWEIKLSSYIDEFQIDSADRKLFADQYLVIGEFWTELTKPEKSENHLEAVFRYSRSNIAFGIHNGVLTTFKVGSVPLLPHELGQKERLDVLFSFSNTSNLFLILNYYHLFPALEKILKDEQHFPINTKKVKISLNPANYYGRARFSTRLKNKLHKIITWKQ